MNMLLQNIKKNVSGFLERLARANQATFGNSRIDCCSVNKAGTARYHVNTPRSDKKQNLKP